MKFKGFVGGSYQVRGITFDAQRCVNLYPEIDESMEGKDGQIGFLAGTPGLELKLTLPDSPGRAGGLYYASVKRTFCVAGSTLFEIKGTGYVEIGNLSTSNGPVCMTDNGQQLAIVDGTYGYVYTFASDTFARITDPDMPKANRCAFIDQYVLFNDVGTSKFYWSDLLDASSVDALDFASAEGQPDLLNSLAVLHRQVWLFGDITTEIWMDTGGIDSAFARIDGVFIEVGCVAPQSVQKLNNSLIWLGNGDSGYGIVWRSEGLQPKRISTHAIEYQLSLLGDLSGATSWAYTDGGHQFYVLNVPGAKTSWVYDCASSLWHERAYFDNGQYELHRGIAHAMVGHDHYVLDRENGNVYMLTESSRTDAGKPIRWMRSSPFMANSLNRIFHKKLQVDIQAGMGLQTGQGSNPTVMMRYTNDGGRTWTPERQAGMGAIGQYTYRCMWFALGQSRTRAYEVSGSDPVPIYILSAETDVEGGAN